MADRAPSSNVYTVLVLIAFLALACAIGYVWYRSGQLFNTGNPFTVVSTPAASWAGSSIR